MIPARTRRISRREFLQTASACCGILAVSLQARDAAAGWDSVAKILGRIRPPVFPQRDINITRYGAAEDGITDCSEALRQAIDACTQVRGRPRHRAGRRFPDRTHSSAQPCKPASCRRRQTAIHSGPRPVSSRRVHALGRRGMHELLPLHLCIPTGEHRSNRIREYSMARQTTNTGGIGPAVHFSAAAVKNRTRWRHAAGFLKWGKTIHR